MTRVTVLGPQRRKPEIGDRRTTKKHGLQIRVVETRDGMWVLQAGKTNAYRYDWKKPAELIGTRWEYLLRAGEVHA